MAKFKVLKRFIDKDTKDLYEVGQEIELTVKRSEEVNRKLGDALERVDNKESKKEEAPKETEKAE